MYAQIEKSKRDKSRAVANVVCQKKSTVKQGFGFVDNRAETITQRKLQRLVFNPRLAQLKALENIANDSNVVQLVRKRWTWNGNNWVPDAGSAVPQPPYRANVVGAVCITDEPDVTATPDTQIAWPDLVSWAEDAGCIVQDVRQQGTFLGPNGANTYPHFHVWINGNIALSFAHNNNVVVGRNGNVDIATLGTVLERRNLDGPIKAVIQKILSSAS